MMGLAEEMLATMPVDDSPVSYLSSNEEDRIVVNESRQIIVPNSLKTIAVTGDKDIETISFDCVRYWDGNDLSTFAIYLNYVLPDKSSATYIPESITTDQGDEYFHFDWKIKNNITKTSGKIAIAIVAIKTKVDDFGNTIIDKQWGSLPNSDCSIEAGIGISNVPDEDETSDIAAQLTAILEKIQGDLDEWVKNTVVQTTGTSKTYVMSQDAVTREIGNAKEETNNYSDSKNNKSLEVISRNSKRITNMEFGISNIQIDNSVSYQKIVPNNTLTYAEIEKIGGISYRDTLSNTIISNAVNEVESSGSFGNSSIFVDPFFVQKLLEGYGLGINENINNHISWDNLGNVKWNVHVKRKVFNGKEGWSSSAYFTNAYAYQLQQSYLTDYKAGTGIGICSHFDTEKNNSLLTIGAVFGNRFTIVTPYSMGFSDATKFKNFIADQYEAGTPLTIDYVIVEPIITDVSDILTRDNMIMVESGGTIVFRNVNSSGVPSTVKFRIQ